MKRPAVLVASLTLSLNALAGDQPIPSATPNAPVTVETIPLPSSDPCADDCGVPCGKGASCAPAATCSVKRPRIVVHQAAPIVEVRQITDSQVRLCGGHGGGGVVQGGCATCGGAAGPSTVINKYKHNTFGCAAPLQPVFQAPVALQAAPMTYAAVAPMAVPMQQVAVQQVAVPQMVTQQVAVAAAPQLTVASVPQLSVATQQVAVAPQTVSLQAVPAAAPASISAAELRAVVQMLGEGSAKSASAGAADFKAASVDDMKGLEGRVKNLEDRVARIERKISALCETN